MRELKINRVYRHFKGKEYIVLGESVPQSRISGELIFDRVIHTEERGNLLNIFRTDEGFIHWKQTSSERLVIYMALYGNYQVYARPYDMFLSKMDEGRTSDCNSVYRMEEVLNIPAGYAKYCEDTSDYPTPYWKKEFDQDFNGK